MVQRGLTQASFRLRRDGDQRARWVKYRQPEGVLGRNSYARRAKALSRSRTDRDGGVVQAHVERTDVGQAAHSPGVSSPRGRPRRIFNFR